MALEVKCTLYSREKKCILCGGGICMSVALYKYIGNNCCLLQNFWKLELLLNLVDIYKFKFSKQISVDILICDLKEIIE